ncbi:hypothetical protein TNCV_5078601 [Trichonephila clavipes]|nr:hypothetical protein TNCV_5078601 [Trichonephila clavipes]
MNKIRKTPATGFESYCSIVEFLAVDVYTATIMKDEDILELVQSSKNIIDADSDYKNEMNKVAPVPTSSEMKSIIKRVFIRDVPRKNKTEGPGISWQFKWKEPMAERDLEQDRKKRKCSFFSPPVPLFDVVGSS